MRSCCGVSYHVYLFDTCTCRRTDTQPRPQERVASLDDLGDGNWGCAAAGCRCGRCGALCVLAAFGIPADSIVDNECFGSVLLIGVVLSRSSYQQMRLCLLSKGIMKHGRMFCLIFMGEGVIRNIQAVFLNKRLYEHQQSPSKSWANEKTKGFGTDDLSKFYEAYYWLLAAAMASACGHMQLFACSHSCIASFLASSHASDWGLKPCCCAHFSTSKLPSAAPIVMMLSSIAMECECNQSRTCRWPPSAAATATEELSVALNVEIQYSSIFTFPELATYR